MTPDKPATKLPRTPSERTWRRVIRQAHAGDWRHLLELLVQPHTTTGRGEPIGFYALPDDAQLRYDVVRTLLFGPKGNASTIAELATRTGFGKGKPKVSDFEVSAAKALMQLAADPDEAEEILRDFSEGLNVEPETLKKRIDKS